MSQRPKTPSKEVEIDGQHFRVYLLPPMGAGLEIGAKLLAMAAEPFGAALGAAGQDESSQRVGVEGAIKALGSKVGSPEAVEIVRRLLVGAEVKATSDGGVEVWRPLTDGDLFGRYAVLAELVAFGVRENFADFFRAGPVAGLLSAVRGHVQGQSIPSKG